MLALSGSAYYQAHINKNFDRTLIDWQLARFKTYIGFGATKALLRERSFSSFSSNMSLFLTTTRGFQAFTEAIMPPAVGRQAQKKFSFCVSRCRTQNMILAVRLCDTFHSSLNFYKI